MRIGLLLFSLLCISSAHAAINSAAVTGGKLEGQVSDKVSVFKGIPFAAPPIGALRWQVPQPVVPWKDVRHTDTFAPACNQPRTPQKKLPNPSEDCLYLNVWTAAASARERRPVIVWVHGGGLTGGMSWEKVSDGSTLSLEGAVVVTIAYRLGALGFAAHPALTKENGRTSGNYGLHDVVSGLRWVQSNIAQFGGDPSRVLLMGGSAGAWVVSSLAASPQAKGLYSRAAAFGGSSFQGLSIEDPAHPYFYATLKTGEQRGEELFKQLGVQDLAAARALAADAILKATEKSQPIYGFIRDGELLMDYNQELFEQRRFNDTPTIVGYTTDEAGDPPPDLTYASVMAELAKMPCQQTLQGLATVYPLATNDEQMRAVVRQVNRDAGVGLATWIWARMQATYGTSPVFAYSFDLHGADRPHGAMHATEYPYVFGNFWPEHYPEDREKNRAASKLIRGYLINFAANGDPNGKGLPQWQRFNLETQQVMGFYAAPSSREWPNLKAFNVLSAHMKCMAETMAPAAAKEP